MPRLPFFARRRAAGALALAAAVAAGAGAIAGCSGGAIGANAPQSSGQSFVSGSGTTVFKAGSRPKAPDIAGTTLAGQHLSLSSFHGSVVVLNFWASWCGPCRAEAPDLAALASQLRSRDVRFLGVDMRDDKTAAAGFERSFRTGYPSLNDPGSQIALAFRTTVPPGAIPTTLIIDRTGHIAVRVLGSVSYDSLKSLLTQVSGARTLATAGGGS